jgi:hypothetical protein
MGDLPDGLPHYSKVRGDVSLPMAQSKSSTDHVDLEVGQSSVPVSFATRHPIDHFSGGVLVSARVFATFRVTLSMTRATNGFDDELLFGAVPQVMVVFVIQLTGLPDVSAIGAWHISWVRQAAIPHCEVNS